MAPTDPKSQRVTAYGRLILRVLASAPCRLTHTQIADQVGCCGATASSQLRRLVRQHLVKTWNPEWGDRRHFEILPSAYEVDANLTALLNAQCAPTQAVSE